MDIHWQQYGWVAPGETVSGLAVLPPTPNDIQRMIRVSDAYGYWIASPGESAAVTG